MYPKSRSVRRGFVLGLLSLATAGVQAAIIGHWTFNDDTVNDVSGNGHDGEVRGGYSYVDTPGGRGLSLDGNKNAVAKNVGSGVTIPAHVDLDPTGPDAISVEVWIDIDTDNESGANNQWIARRADSKYGIGFKSDGGLNRITYFQNGYSGFETAPGEVDTPGFHHIVYTKNVGDQWVLYLDNQLVWGGGGAAGWVDNGPSDILLGWGGGNALKGVWDEVTIHDVKLTAQQVSDSFVAGPTGIPTIEFTHVTFPNTLSVCVTGEFGVVYTLQAAGTAAGPYTDLGLPVTGGGENLYFLDTSPAGSGTKFYRVQVQP